MVPEQLLWIHIKSTWMKSKSLAITQPYIFPYINYFHLIEASDKIIFYDDINYIKGGWINRNRILSHGKDLLISIPVIKGSQNKCTNEVAPLLDEKFINKTYNSLRHAYSKAKYYSTILDLIINVLSEKHESVADLAIASIQQVMDYLGTSLKSNRSSICSPATKGMDKSDRLIEITKQEGYTEYVNVIWGQHIHHKQYFKNNGITLHYLESMPTYYKQFNNNFVPLLSIIDVMMFNDIDTIKDMMTAYKII